jgi:hypothetical protein
VGREYVDCPRLRAACADHRRTWQGTLPIPEKPRRIIKIDKNDNGSLRGVMYRIDYDASSIPLTVSFQAPDLRLVQDILDNIFQGKLSAHGKSITGSGRRISKPIRAHLELGFKLVPKKEPLEVIVIDHLEKPSAN